MEQTTRTVRGTVLASRDEPLTRLHKVAIALAATTGIVHLYLYWAQEFVPFLLAGLGFFGAVVLLVSGVNRRLLYAVGVPFTAAQIAVWVAQGMPEFALGAFDKTVQVALIAVLTYLFVSERRSLRTRTLVPAEASTEAVAPVATGR